MGGVDSRRRPRRPRPRGCPLRRGRLADQGPPRHDLRRAAVLPDRHVAPRSAPHPHVPRGGGRLRPRARPLRAARVRARAGHPDAVLPHRPRPAHGRAGARVRPDQPGLAARTARLAVREPAQPPPRAELARHVPQRDRSRQLPHPPRERRLPALPGPHVAGQGRGQRGARRARGGAAAAARRQDPRPDRARVLRRRRPPLSVRCDRVRRRGVAQREGRAAAEGRGDGVPDPVAGAVRARDGRVDGVRDAGARDPPRRGARSRRARARRLRRRHDRRDGGSASRRCSRSIRTTCARWPRSASRPGAWCRTTSARTSACWPSASAAAALSAGSGGGR